MRKRQGSLLAAVVTFAVLASLAVTMLSSAAVTRKAAARRAQAATDLYTFQAEASIGAQQLLHDLGTLTARSPYDPLELSVNAYQASCESIYSRLFDSADIYVVDDLPMIIDFAGLSDMDTKSYLLRSAARTDYQLEALDHLEINYADPDNTADFSNGDCMALNDFEFLICVGKGNLQLEQHYKISGLYADVSHDDNGYTISIRGNNAVCELLQQHFTTKGGPA